LNTTYFNYSPVNQFNQIRINQVKIGDTGDVTFWDQTFNNVSDPVNPITGAFHIDATDLEIPGPYPLKVRRNYSSQNLSDQNNFGYGWRINYLPYLMVTTNKTTTQTNLMLYAAEEDGSVIAYRQQSNTNLYLPKLADNPTLDNETMQGMGATANMFNARITRSLSGTNIIYTLASPDGGLRVFQVMNFPLIGLTNNASRTRPYLQTWTDYRGNSRSFFYGTNSTTPDSGQLVRIQCSNGNFVGFDYNTAGYISDVFTGDGRRLHYDYDSYGDLVTVTLPDVSQINYEYNHYGFAGSDGNMYYDSDHSLVREIKPEGRILQNIYDAQRRVVAQMATVGPDLDVYTNAYLTYSNNFSLSSSE
jgi:YD repeat-containing protein